MSIAITSDEVNFLIYRYLLESGFQHSSFAFEHESQVAHRCNDFAKRNIKAGALIHLLQKGLQYLEVEMAVNAELEEPKHAPFNLAKPTKKKPRRNGPQQQQSHGSGATASQQQHQQRHHQQQQQMQRQQQEQASSQNDIEPKHEPGAATTPNNITNGDSMVTSPEISAVPVPNGGPASDEPIVGVKLRDTDIPPAEVTVLEGHTAEIFACAWNPIDPMVVATGSNDYTGRIWDASNAKSTVLRAEKTGGSENRQVTTLDWTPDGEYLATGSYDGKARIWAADGTLKFLMDRHDGPIFSLQWNRRGTYLLSGSVDKTAIVWDGRTGEMKQQFAFHDGWTLDVDWLDDETFATCSSDHTIHVCKVGYNKPLKTFYGHSNEINTVRWDPTGTLLASCSDDASCKVWTMSEDVCIRDFQEHTKQAYTIKWCPLAPPPVVSPKKERPSTGADVDFFGVQWRDQILASASFDSTVKLWDVFSNTCLRTFSHHMGPVFSISWTTDGRYLATGSFDSKVCIWDAYSGKLRHFYQGQASIFEVTWRPKRTAIPESSGVSSYQRLGAGARGGLDGRDWMRVDNANDGAEEEESDRADQDSQHLAVCFANGTLVSIRLKLPSESSPT